ncbi:MAG TPA: LuxR family transcriptional regulator, partial [Thermoanaerobaculia bacterium]|nr:LuxR family transcriptional regulator [Thermoanaerobaculia bacterium]
MTRGLAQRYPGELPREVTGFVGRGRELGALAGLLGAVRLVTVTGTAGVGKTRVALRAATLVGEGFADGVCFAELGGLRDLDLVPHTVAACLGLPEQDARSGTDAVVGYLSERNALLVLDTCEHVIGGCVPLIGALLRDAPGVTVLAVSRQPLDMPGEHVFPLPPLSVPAPGEAGGGDAVELFAQRAAAAVPGFTVSDANRCEVVALCRRLDGIPLAIELAAVQLRATSLGALSGGLEHRFLTLTGGGRGFAPALPHQQTLRAAIQWSYDLCSPAERLLWARLSVFAGSFGIPGAQDVCAGGHLDRAEILPALIGLLDKSVVLRPAEDEPRYRLLDTIREFGAERLAESGEQAAVRGRHVAYFIGLAEDFGAHDKDGDQLARFRELRGEHQNFRAALGYALGAPGAPGDERLAARLASALRPYWEISGLLREGRHWMDKVLTRFPGPSAERARLLLTRGVLAIFQGELRDAIADLEASTALSAAVGDALACALGHTYQCLAFVFSGRHAEAVAAGAAAEERLHAVGHLSGLVSLDIHLGYLHLLSGDPDLAIERCTQGLRRLDGGERWARSYLLVITALGLFLRGEGPASAVAARDSLQMKHEVGDLTGMAYCLETLAMLAAGQGRFPRTAWLLGAADTLWERTGKRLGGTAAIEGLHQWAASTARDGLGDKRYERLFRDGASRELAEIVGLAASDADKLPARSGGQLTKREREVAVLVAEGLTNS